MSCGHVQAHEDYLRSFFNALATLRIFTVLPSTRALMFDVARSLQEVGARIILLAVRAWSRRAGGGFGFGLEVCRGSRIGGVLGSRSWCV